MFNYCIIILFNHPVFLIFTLEQMIDLKKYVVFGYFKIIIKYEVHLSFFYKLNRYLNNTHKSTNHNNEFSK